MAKVDVWQGTLALMILKTIEALGPMHGYGIARRIEQTSGDRCYLSAEWGTSDAGRRARFYRLTRAGRRQVAREAQQWEETTAILARFLAFREEPS